MRRPFVLSIGALALALLPAVVSAQEPAAKPPAQPAAAKVALTSPAGALLVPIKPDQTAVFEEYATKLKAGLAATTDATLKQQAAGMKIYKAAELFGPNALFVITIDPAVPNAEYDLFALLQKTMTEEQQRAPETQEMWKRFAGMFAAPPSRLSLTPAGK